MKQFVFCLLFFSTASALAATSWVTYPTDVNNEMVNGELKMYVGRTSNTNNGVCTDTNTCDTCSADGGAVAANSVCSIKDVLTTKEFSFQIKSDKTFTGTVYSQIIDKTSNGAVTLTNSPSYTTGSTIEFKVRLLDICSKVTGTACTRSFKTTLNIGFNTDNSTTLTEFVVVQFYYRYADGATAGYTYQQFGCTGTDSYEGFCYFRLFPGDKKAYINVGEGFNPSNSSGIVARLDDQGAANTADPSGIKYHRIRLFYRLGGTANDTPNTFAPWTVNNTGGGIVDLDSNIPSGSVDLTITPGTIRGLENTGGPAYVFTSASMDQAGIVTHFTNPATPCQAPYVDATLAKNPGNESQCITPEPVYGLIEGQECFIATAAFGSPMAQEVDTFRAFRNKYLLTNSLGRKFVALYYQHSPSLAKWIQQSEELRFLSRMLLYPLLLFSSLTLMVGLPMSMVLVVLLGFFGLSLLRFLRQRSYH